MIKYSDNEKNILSGTICNSKDEFAHVYPLMINDRTKHCKTVTFVVTEGCTLRCTYCYERHKNNNVRMNFDTAKKFVDLLFEEDAKETELVSPEESAAIILDFIGGEPLLEIKLIDQIVEYFLKKAVELNHRWKTEFMISMISNGTEYFTPEVQAFVKKYRNRLSLSITIDGNRDLHDACRRTIDGKPNFEIAEKAYKDCLARGLTSSTKMTIAPANLKYLSEALKNLCSYEGVREVPANPVFEEQWTLEQATEYYNQLKDFGQWFIDNDVYETVTTTLFVQHGIGCPLPEELNRNYCGGTGKMLACAVNGKIYPCMRYVPFALQNKDIREEMILGTVDGGLCTTEEQKNRFSCLDCITLRSQSEQKCIDCPIATGCGWCSGWNFDYYGTPNKRYTGICNMHKARVMANVWYWNTLYRKLGMEDRFPMNIPKEWALEIIDEDEYNMLVNLAKSE